MALVISEQPLRQDKLASPVGPTEQAPVRDGLLRGKGASVGIRLTGPLARSEK